jgi:hypothetical protein
MVYLSIARLQAGGPWGAANPAISTHVRPRASGTCLGCPNLCASPSVGLSVWAPKMQRSGAMVGAIPTSTDDPFSTGHAAVTMLLGVCTLSLVPQRAFTTQHRGRRQHAVSMEAVAAPQAPPQTVSANESANEQDAAFAAIIDRCENFAEDFDGFLQVAEDLRAVFHADFQQYKTELRAAATSQNARPFVYIGQASQLAFQPAGAYEPAGWRLPYVASRRFRGLSR